MVYDVTIIGAGITGSLLARELARYQLNILVLEKDNDVGNATTNANSAIIHSGYDPVPNTLKAKLNVLGNKKFDKLADELDVSFKRIGSLTVAIYDEQLKLLDDLKKRSEENGVETELLTKEQVLGLEPNISKEVKGALLAKTAGVIDPFNLCVHAMENAIDNGVTLKLNSEVTDIKKENDLYCVKTSDNEYQSKIVINCAGNYSDKIASMVEEISWSVNSRKGEYYILDNLNYSLVNHVIFPLPSEKGKGILVSPTYAGNFLVGPSSESVFDKEDYSTDKETLANVRKQATDLVPNIPFFETIRVFSGLRPTPSTHDFVIGYSKKDKHFINVAGIESPGLASSPAIAEYVINDFVKPIIDLVEKKDFNPRVRRYVNVKDLDEESKKELVAKNKDYGQIICNCEQVTLGEINDALSRSCPPRSIKALKKRTRAGFGRCQGGFCQPHVAFILAKHYGVSPLDVLLDSGKSNILVEKVKNN